MDIQPMGDCRLLNVNICSEYRQILPMVSKWQAPMSCKLRKSMNVLPDCRYLEFQKNLSLSSDITTIGLFTIKNSGEWTDRTTSECCSLFIYNIADKQINWPVQVSSCIHPTAWFKDILTLRPPKWKGTQDSVQQHTSSGAQYRSSLQEQMKKSPI